MDYYSRIHIYHHKEKYTTDSSVELSNDLKFNFNEGKRLPEELVNVIVASQSKKIPDIFGNLHRPIVSNKLKQLLETLDDVNNFQFMKAVVAGSKKEFWFLNLLNPVQCLDKENSVFDTFESTDSIKRVTKLSMHIETIGDRNLFRMKEYPLIIFISPKLEKMMKDSELSGYQIADTDDPTND